MHKLTKAFAALTLMLAMATTSTALAEPTSPQVLIKSIRPYKAGAAPVAFIYLATPAICNTTIFTIDLADPSGPALLSVALTALTAKKNVVVEISNATGCTGNYTALQSITIIDN
jgi:hypothetical protein